jgi:hypothetical protein
LIVAASSIHWIDLDVTLPRFADALADGATLAVLDGDAPLDAPWEREETAFMIDFLEARGERRRGWWMTMRERLAAPRAGASAIYVAGKSDHCARLFLTVHRGLSPMPAFALDVVGRSSRRKGVG